MDYQRKRNGFLTFLEHWWFLSIAITGIVGSQFLAFFTRLTGTPWLWCYAVGLAVASVGIALIFYAKVPLYRRLQFFNFGGAALPENRRVFYHWGYRCIIFAAVLLLCLLASEP